MEDSGNPPSEVNELIQNAVERLECNEFEGALNLTSKALAVEPCSVKAIVLQGRIRAGMGEFQLALKEFELAIEIDQSDTSAHYDQGMSHFELEDMGQAIASFSRAIA